MKKDNCNTLQLFDIWLKHQYKYKHYKHYKLLLLQCSAVIMMEVSIDIINELITIYVLLQNMRVDTTVAGNGWCAHL